MVSWATCVPWRGFLPHYTWPCRVPWFPSGGPRGHSLIRQAATFTSQVTAMTDSISTVRSELVPTGTLRVALNMSNFLLTATDPVTGEPCGIAADLGRELGQRLGVPIA